MASNSFNRKPSVCRRRLAQAALFAVLCVVAATATLGAADTVTIDSAKGGCTVQTEVYTANVDQNAVLTSLLIAGVEFLAPPTEAIGPSGEKTLVPSLFACPHRQWERPHQPPSVRQRRSNSIQAEGNGWKLTYTFHADTIDLAFEGVPAGGRGFKTGYPPDELAISLAHDLDRACDPDNQGEFGWPVKRKHEPGNFVVLAKNGAGLIAERAARIQAVEDQNRVVTPPHRLDLLVFSTHETNLDPLRTRLRMFRRPALSHSVTMEIQAPNHGHLFSGTEDVVFPIKVSVLYGQTLIGAVAFKGGPYVWKTPEVVAETPIELTESTSVAVVPLRIRPPKPGHYTGQISITDGRTPQYRQRVGFLFKSERIPPVVPPADFDAFWEKTMAELDMVPLDLTLEEREDLATAAGRVYKAKYRSWNGRWAWAWLYTPNAETKVAATLVLPPVSVYQPPPPSAADGALRIMVAVHGGDLKDYPAKPDFDYMRTGITSREAYMLRYSYCCLTRCFDIIKRHEKCNGEIEIEGSSQGAGLSLVLSGLRDAKSARGTAVALCRPDWTVLGYTEWGPRAPEGADPKQIAEVVRYYDPACFAHRIRTPLQLATGLFDFCAPAEGIFTAINALPKETRCRVFIDPYGGHFTLDLSAYHLGQGIMEVPRWFGTAADNKLGP